MDPHITMHIDERKEESMIPNQQFEEFIDVSGTIKFYERNEMLMAECKLQTQDLRISLRRRVILEVAENIFDQIYLIHNTAEIFGLHEWQNIRINYLSREDYDDPSLLRLTLLKYFCEVLNDIEIIL